MKTFALISLGCPRNLVDSEVIAGALTAGGLRQRDVEDGVDVCLVNTCAFVESAREESVDAIIEIANLKKSGKVKYLVICGCLPQLYKAKLARQLPEADLTIGTSDFPRIAELVTGLARKRGVSVVSSQLKYLYDEDSPRVLSTPKHYAYIKIAEGCSNFCSYCIISRLRGEFRSRSIESVLSEVRAISSSGMLKEIELIAQDATFFGMDRYGEKALPRLLKSLCAAENSVQWIRLLYTHPAHYSDELIETIRAEKRICKYLDLPIQHISDHVLTLMNRKVSKAEIVALIKKLRKRIPGLVLRTSVIVGFPGETGKDFTELLSFLKDTKFERLGAFKYSREEGTAAAGFSAQVPESVKQDRYDAVMKLQQQISGEALRRYLGKRVEVLIDEKVESEDDTYIGRTRGDAPDVDGVVYVTGKRVKVGDFCAAHITDTLEYDLVGEAV